MRWRLLFAAALLTGLAGALASSGVLFGIGGVRRAALDVKPTSTLLLALAPCLIAFVCGANFVYRHTARRRVFQALLVVFLSGGIAAATFLLVRSLL